LADQELISCVKARGRGAGERQGCQRFGQGDQALERTMLFVG